MTFCVYITFTDSKFEDNVAIFAFVNNVIRGVQWHEGKFQT